MSTQPSGGVSKIVLWPGMANSPGPELGCAFIGGLILASPWIIAAVPALFGITLGILAFIAVGLLVQGVFWYIWR